MNSGRDDITSKQLVTFIISSQISIGILTLPRQLADKAGHDGWISVIASGFICCCLIAVIAMLLNRYNNKSIIQINKILYGRYLGNLFNLCFIFYLFYTTCYLFRSLINIVQQTALPYTPVIITSCIIILPSLYLGIFGLKYICRYSILVYLVIAATIFLFILIRDNLKITFLMPVVAAGISKIAASMKISIISLMGFELVAIIYPYITDKKNVLKKALKANAITVSFYVIVLLITTSLFGENFLKRLVYPLFSLSRAYRAPIFERLDLFYVALWFPAMAGSTRIYMYCTQVAVMDLLGIQPKKIYMYIQVFLIISFSRLPKNFMDMERYGGYLSYVALAILTSFVFSFLFSFINKRRVER